MSTEQGKTAQPKKKLLHRQESLVKPGPAVQREEPDLLALQRAVANPAMATPADILALERTVGNRNTSRVLHGRSSVRKREKSADKAQGNLQREVIQRMSNIEKYGKETDQPKNQRNWGMCMQAVGYVLHKLGKIKKAERAKFNNWDGVTSWMGNPTPLEQPFTSAPKHAVILIEYTYPQAGGRWTPAHVMLSDGDGWAWGRNNGSVLNGSPQWSKYLLSYFKDAGGVKVAHDDKQLGWAPGGRTVRLFYKVP